MAQFQRHFVQELTKPLIVRQCGDLGFSGDNDSDVISVDLYTDGEPYSGGGTCAGACICPDGSTVALTGSISGKTASVTLKEDCFAIPGHIGIGIRVTTGTTKTTVLKCIYNVDLFATNNPVDPGSRIALDVGDLINRIDAAVESIPASADQLKAAMAPNFSDTTAYPAGAYVWNNGTLYRFTTAHAAGSWTGTDATAVALGNDVADLNITSLDNSNVIADITGCVTPINIILGSINTNTGADSASQDGSRLRTNYIPVIAGNAYSIKLTNDNSSSSATVWIVYYDATKTIVPSSENLGAAASGATLTVNKTMPSGTAYIRFRISGTGLSPSEETLEVSNYTVGGVPSFRGVISTATDLNDYITPGIWQLNSTAYIPDHFPEITDGGKIVVIASNNALSSATTFQFVVSYSNGLFYRYSSSNNNWSGWKKIINEDDLSASINAVKADSLLSYDLITTTGLDLNSGDFIHPGTWVLQDMTYKPNNYYSQNPGRIISFATDSQSSFSTVQVIVDLLNNIYVRVSSSNGTFSNWATIAKTTDVDTVKSNAVYSYSNITTAGLDLNSGDFIHPGMWSVNNTDYLPKNCPVSGRCRIISFASSTNNSIYTYQIVIDADNYNVYERFSTNNNTWTQWTHRNGLRKNLSFPCSYTKNEPFVNDYTIAQDTESTGRVSRLYALYDAVSDNAVSIDKDPLGTSTPPSTDQSEIYNIYNYKVSLKNNTTDKPIVLIICGQHGNELNSALIGYYLYKEVVTGVLQKYLRFVDFWIVPLMNPYGYEHLLRDNAAGVNLNRDFPAEWSYSNNEHDKTGDYSLSQQETNYIYNLIVNNKSKILFLCNKHDTGSITKKISTDQPDLVAYVSTHCITDSAINHGISAYQDYQVKNTDAWIINDCTQNIDGKQLIVSLNNKTPGSMDLFANAIGVHGSLLEVSGAAYYGSDVTPYYPAQHLNDMARLGLDFFVNYVAQTIENNIEITHNDDLTEKIKFYTRVLVDGAYVLKEQYWNGSELITL